jgi:AcrR family transcriptional regulator
MPARLSRGLRDTQAPRRRAGLHVIKFYVILNDMNASTLKRYHSPLRRAQAERTRELLLQAAATLLEQDPDNALGAGEVAHVAGVQERTVYRHFANKEALLDALWGWVNQQAGFTAFPTDERELVEQPRTVFAGFDEIEGIVRASLTSRTGREMRLRQAVERRKAFTHCLQAATAGLPPERVRQAQAVIHLLYSAAAWQTMKDFAEMTGPEAGSAASWAIATLLDALRHEAAAGQTKPIAKSPPGV